MEPTPVQTFVLALLDVGDRLTRLVDNLIEGYVESAGCSEDQATAEILAMVFGTASVRMASIPDEEFERGAKLLRRTFTAVLADVEGAAELARRRHHGHHHAPLRHG
jgi:hypothetical protein